MLDSLTPTTAQHLQLGEGLLLADLDMVALLAEEDPAAAIALAAEDDAHCIGATLPGCVFRCEPHIVHTEQRGHRTPVDGSLLSGGWYATLSGTMLAVTPANAARLMNLPCPEEAILPAGTYPVTNTAMENLCWIGSVGRGYIAIELLAPVHIGGLTLRSGDRNPGEMPFTFLAQQPGTADDAPPFRLHFLPGGDA